MITHLKTNKNRAFAMLEVLIAMLVITTLLSTFVIPGLTLNNYQKRKETHIKMQTIQKALNQYILSFGRLPCPVLLSNGPTVAYTETISSEQCSSTTVSSFNSSTQTIGTFTITSSILYGAVPVDTLQIARSYAQDGWGNKIVYAVPSDLTYSSSYSYPGRRPIIFYNNQSSASYNMFLPYTLGGTYFFPQDFSNYITTKYKVSSTETTLRDGNLYILLSYGENGYGAYTFAGDQNATAGNSTNGESDNIFISIKADNFVYTNSSSSLSGGLLDDIVYATSSNDVLAVDNSGQNIYCDYRYTPAGSSAYSALSTASLSYGAVYLNTPHYRPDAILEILNECSTGCDGTKNGFKHYIRCLSGGQWSSPYKQPCSC